MLLIRRVVAYLLGVLVCKETKRRVVTPQICVRSSISKSPSGTLSLFLFTYPPSSSSSHLSISLSKPSFSHHSQYSFHHYQGFHSFQIQGVQVFHSNCSTKSLLSKDLSNSSRYNPPPFLIVVVLQVLGLWFCGSYMVNLGLLILSALFSRLLILDC